MQVGNDGKKGYPTQAQLKQALRSKVSQTYLSEELQPFIY